MKYDPGWHSGRPGDKEWTAFSSGRLEFISVAEDNGTITLSIRYKESGTEVEHTLEKFSAGVFRELMTGKANVSGFSAEV